MVAPGALRHRACITPSPPSLVPLLAGAAAAVSLACGRSPRDEATAEPAMGIAALQSSAVQPPAPSLPPPPTPPACADDAWSTYGHDAARTSASAGCLSAPLRLAWSFSPHWVKGTPSHATRAVVAGDAVYATGGIGPTPTVWRLDATSGAIVWTYVTMADATRDGWPTLAGAKVMLVDDGAYSIDAATGSGHRGELDAWGESLVDGDRMYAENDRYWDGYGLYLAAFDLEAKRLWRRDYDALVRFFSAPDVGGLALDGGRLVHSAQHGALRTTRLSAYDPASGEMIWKQDVSPQSSPSMAGGRVFVVERWKGEATDRLVARSAQDGAVAWSRELADARGPAPLLAADLVVVHARDGVHAFDRGSGAPAWTTSLPRTAQPVQSATTLAAATGSGTLAVLSGREVHLLQLRDGSDVWSFTPAPRARRLEGPVIAGTALYVMADGALLRLDGAAEAPVR